MTLKKYFRVRPSGRGPEVSFDAENFFKGNASGNRRYGGEGEETFLELARYYIEKKGTLADIRGIAFRENGEIFQQRMAGSNGFKQSSLCL